MSQRPPQPLSEAPAGGLDTAPCALLLALPFVLLLVLLFAGGCAGPRPPRAPAYPPALVRWTGPPPGPAQVRQAATWLHEELLRRHPPWPEGLTRSRDFSNLPLVDVLPVADRGRWGLDTGLLQRTLEEAVRRHGLLRLLADEQAVPAFLRDPAPRAQHPAPPAPRLASLLLEGWTASDGRFHLTLRRRGALPEEDGEPLVTVESARADGF